MKQRAFYATVVKKDVVDVRVDLWGKYGVLVASSNAYNDAAELVDGCLWLFYDHVTNQEPWLTISFTAPRLMPSMTCATRVIIANVFIQPYTVVFTTINEVSWCHENDASSCLTQNTMIGLINNPVSSRLANAKTIPMSLRSFRKTTRSPVFRHRDIVNLMPSRAFNDLARQLNRQFV